MFMLTWHNKQNHACFYRLLDSSLKTIWPINKKDEIGITFM